MGLLHEFYRLCASTFIPFGTMVLVCRLGSKACNTGRITIAWPFHLGSKVVWLLEGLLVYTLFGRSAGRRLTI